MIEPNGVYYGVTFGPSRLSVAARVWLVDREEGDAK